MAQDIVRLFESICDDKSIQFHNGPAKVLNLLDGTNGLEADKIYLLHERTERKSEYNDSKTKIVATVFDGKFFLVKHSDFDQHYFQEVGSQETSKYVTNIEPLLETFKSIGNYFACRAEEVLVWSNIDVTDALDGNYDGLLCTYKIRIPE